MENRNLLISAEELHSSIGDADLRIVDCRFELMRPEAGRLSYQQKHIPGAVYADLDHDLAAPVSAGTGRHPLPHAAVLADTFGRLGISAGTQVVVYDDLSGGVAARAWWLLRWLGHERVALLDGGITRWQGLGFPLEEGEIDVVPRTFSSAPRHDCVLETADILAAGLPCDVLQLVDARAANRFSGEAEPIDPVAGHIPGAINLPFSKSVNDDGTWKSEDELRQLWSRVLGNGQNAPWSVMCGSGVTACHLAISGLLAGLPEPKLYVGSWSEWICDPRRAIATGASDQG